MGASLQPGKWLGPYELRDRLGAGGMGEVYRARDTRLDREVAIKVLPERLANDADALARFEREAKAVAALSHPNILAVYDVGRHENISYVVMELLEGETLRSRITRSALPPRKAVEVGIAIADGLSAAHAKGIIHRDLKPENIFITTDGQVKILDFGLARSIGPTQGTTHDLANSPTLTIETTPGAIIGTLCYMAPEQVRALATDARTDIFAFGCVMYEMLTAQRAFLGETAADTMTSILKEEPKSVRTLSASVGPELERFIDRCLEKRPEQRFQSSTDLAFSLRSILSHDEHPPVAARSSTRWLTKAGVAVVLLATVILGVRTLRRESSQARPESREVIDSLAVLPFVNASGNDSVEYLGDGITESLINTLSRIERLRVIPTSTSFRYKGKSVDPETVSHELRVRGVVTGKVEQRGDRTIVQAELIDGTTGSQLWGERYDRPAADLLGVEREITKDIVDSLQVRLTGEEIKATAKRYTENEQAYRLYLEGRYWWKKRSEEGINRALQLFGQALSLDPNYALAHVGLADSYLLRGVFYRAPRENFAAAIQAAENAWRLDPTLAEAYAPVAFLRALDDYEWEPSLDLFRRGIESNPRYPTLHHWNAVVLNVMGRIDEAGREITLAAELDPGAVLLQRELGWQSVNTRQYDRAIEQMRRLIEIDPIFVVSYAVLGEALAATKDYEGAMAAFRKLDELGGRFPMHAGQVPRTDALAGRREQALEGLRTLLELDKAEDVYASAIASVYVALGDHDDAFSWLEKAVERREWAFGYTINWPRWDPVRKDPRFDSLLKGMRLSSSDRAAVTGSVTQPAKGKTTLAVLPFENLSLDPEQEYFADGMTEELIGQLGRMNPEKLGIIARTSSMQYKRAKKSIQQIGQELTVDYVVEGSVRRSGDRVRITAQLVDASQQTQLWAETFDRELKDILALQADVARAIARQIQVTVTPQEQARLTAVRPVNPEAYQAYLKGRFYWNKRTSDGLMKAAKQFELAISLAPDWPLAYAGLADAYSLMPWYGPVRPSEAMPKAKEAAAKALEMDESLAEAHTSRAWIAATYDWDWPVAEREYERAIALSPNYATAHHWYAVYFRNMSRHEEAIREITKAQELDPLSLIIGVNVGLQHYYVGDFAQAETCLRKTLELGPDFARTHRDLARTLLLQGKLAEAITEAREAVRLSKHDPWFVAILGYVCAKTGQPEEARRILNEFAVRSKEAYVAPTHFAWVYAGLDERDRMFEWLERAYQERDLLLLSTLPDPLLAPMRSDPRFADLVRRVGLPEIRNPAAPVADPQGKASPGESP